MWKIDKSRTAVYETPVYVFCVFWIESTGQWCGLKALKSNTKERVWESFDERLDAVKYVKTLIKEQEKLDEEA